jgi:hypothetical protein
MKRWLFLFFILTISTLITAQDLKPPRDNYFFLGFGLPIVNVRDEAHSQLKYRGLAPIFRFGFENINGDFVSRITVSTAFGRAKPKTKPKPDRILSGMDISNIQFNYAYYTLINTYSNKNWNQYLGGAATVTLDLRSYSLPSNNLLGYQINFSLNAGGFVQKQSNQKNRFNYEIFTPLLSYSLRPTYLGMLPIKGSDMNPWAIFSNGKIVTVNKLFRLYNRFSFDQQLKPYRAHRLFYSWDFHSNTVSKPLKSVMGGFAYETLFKL